jgi:AcrR family transcriptional regulator
VSPARQRSDFAPKKRPSQERSKATFVAIVEACTWLLPRLGYAGTTTNHIAKRAGVNIASLYEYFPGKDAIVAQVAERLVERVLGRLGAGAEQVLQAHPRDATRQWIELVHETVAREKSLIAVFTYQVAFTSQLDPIRAIDRRLVELSRALRAKTGAGRTELSDASLQLLINLVTSTIMQIVLEPPPDVTPRELLDELIRRVELWLR